MAQAARSGILRLSEAPALLPGPAGVPHRFEDYSEDLAVWVIFYGASGGEVPYSES